MKYDTLIFHRAAHHLAAIADLPFFTLVPDASQSEQSFCHHIVLLYIARASVAPRPASEA